MGNNFWKRIYDKLREFYYKHHISFWDKNYNYFNHCSRILDIGCGLGRFLSFFPKKSVGIDINIDSIEECRRKGFQAIKGEATKLPFENETFDGIRCSHIIEHFLPQEAYKVLKEAARVLKPEGILIIQSPLPSPQFYDEITHIRPYPPNAILSVYLRPPVIQQSFERMPYRFELVKLEWRYASLFYPVFIEPAYKPSKFKMALFLKILSLILYKMKIRSWKKNGYTLVLRKLAVSKSRGNE